MLFQTPSAPLMKRRIEKSFFLSNVSQVLRRMKKQESLPFTLDSGFIASLISIRNIE
jgi:hypothetical protein